MKPSKVRSNYYLGIYIQNIYNGHWLSHACYGGAISRDNSDCLIRNAIFTRGQFWPSGIVVACVCSCGRQSRACPRDNLSLVLARITKFEPDMQNNLIKIPIVLGVDWPWPSRSNLTWKSKFTQFWACPHDHPPPVEIRISKFWPIMHISSVKIPVNFGIDWYWSSISFLIFKPFFCQIYLRYFVNI